MHGLATRPERALCRNPCPIKVKTGLSCGGPSRSRGGLRELRRTAPARLAARPPRCHIHRVTDGTIKAVLGPTNTGKTHLAIERMCAHSSGAIGFPLRLLAREVYDRVVAIKGESQVALIT